MGTQQDYNRILIDAFGDRIKISHDISSCFTLRMRTIAEAYFEPRSIVEWREVIELADEYSIPYLVLGGGSNMAVFSGRIPGLVLRNAYVKKQIVTATQEFTDILFSSGYSMHLAVQDTIGLGLSGFEYFYGLPGTIGGAIYMNSKWTQPISYVGDHFLIGTILDRDGSVREESREYFAFDYDYSKLQDTGEILLEALFRMVAHDKAEVQKRADEVMAYRKSTQPFGVHTGGCFFQNISEHDRIRHSLPNRSAGYLIDQSGLKGSKIGSFEISTKHANFIVNGGDGDPEDLKKLVRLVKDTVFEKFNVILKEEVRIV